MSATTLITPGNLVDLSPDSYAFHPFDALSRSLTNLAGTILANTNLSDRASLSVSYTESGRDSVAVVPEGQQIPETKTVFKNVQVPSVKLAVLKTASNELLEHTNTATSNNATKITMQALQDIQDSADAAIFGSNAPTTPGLTSLPANEDITDLGDLGSNLDWLADALANLVDGGGREEDAIIVASPKAQAALLKLKDEANGNRPLIDTLSGTSQYNIPNPTALTDTSIPVRNLSGVPILVSRNLTDPAALNGGELYILDRPNLLIAATEAVIAMSTDSEFSRDATAFRCTMRIGWKLARPERVSRVTVPA